MLLGRAAETARVDRVLANARLGVSSALVIRGDAGIGKTSLLRYAVEQAAGMRRLSGRGVQFESEVPFAGLHELLLPALPAMDRLPPAAARALASALGIGEREDGDRLLIGAATLQLLVAWAERPLLIAIDDAHWLDRASAETLGFATRRLLADPIAVLIAIREDEASPLLEIGLPELRVGGLDAESAGHLLRKTARAPIPPDLAVRMVEATSGNPLALVEMATEAHRLVEAVTQTPLPLVTSVERSYLRRAGDLSGPARMVLLVVAASGSAGIDQVRRAATDLGLLLSAVEEAESARSLVEIRDGRIEFVHPLARAAIYHAASPADRRAAHRALSRVLAEDDERRVWHLAAAAEGDDETAATELEAAGGRAQLRTGYAEAAAAFDAAARLTADKPRRSRRLLAAARAAWLAGQAERASRLLADLAPEDDVLVAEVRAFSGQIELRRGEIEAGYKTLREAAEALLPHDHLQASHLLAEASLLGFGAGRVPEMLDAGRRALDLLSPDDPVASRIAAHTAYGAAAVLAALADEGPRHLHSAGDLFAEGVELRDPLLMLCAGVVGLFLREAESGRALLERALAGARVQAPAAALPAVLFYLGRDAATTDQWATARGRYEEAARLARETNQLLWLTGALAGLAHLDAEEGRAADLERHAAEAEALAGRQGLRNFTAWVVAARGLLELGAGRPAAAREHLLALRAIHSELGLRDPDIDPAPELVDVHLRLGDDGAAAAEAGAYASAAGRKGQPFALARAERGLALTAPDAEFAGHFEAALGHHAATRDTFERARTQLAYGERLRRARRRRAARVQLAAALEVFDQLGASDWSARALAELGAGEAGLRRDPTVRHRLTAQELQVALALAEGQTIREAAAKLFLSPKTVEYHLRNVYDKLEVRSRGDLRRVLSAG